MLTRPHIFEYLDYRAFLRDMFAFRKKMTRYFSYRFFARESGFASPNFLKLVMDGKRNLTVESVAKVAKGFKLNKGEREFLENLVFMNQATSHEQRNHYYQKMTRLKGFADIQPLEKASYEYFSNWHCPVIREVVTFGDRRHSPETIASLLDPPITPKEAEKTLDLLINLGLIRKDAQGRWEQKDRAVSTGPEVRSLVVSNFHREMIRLAGESIERHPSEQRDITSLTLSVNRSKMSAIKEKTAAFRKELLELACEDNDADQVVQVNIQAFPLTK